MSLVTCPNATGQQHIAPVLVEVVEKNEIISVFLILLARDLVQIVFFFCAYLGRLPFRG